MANTTTNNATGRMQLFGTRTVIGTAVQANPDHNHTRLYVVGEQHLIGSRLMPQQLSSQLVSLGFATEDSSAVTAAWTAQNVINASNLFDANGSPQPEPW